MIEKEKATAYDKAIERAKKLYGNEIAEEIFSELKESDDEKIKKWIIDDIRHNINNEPLNNSEYKKKAEKAIAWLEKQGEQKPCMVQLYCFYCRFIFLFDVYFIALNSCYTTIWDCYTFFT